MKLNPSLSYLKISLLAIFAMLNFGLYGQCTYYAASAGSTPAVTITSGGGFFASYGCAPIDPTYWIAGAGPWITFTFTSPQSNPSIRVWGMNTDDFASVQVNGAPYPMNAVSATELPKVVCGLSPGPLGVVFNGGNIQGGNTPAQGNYSYSDVILNTGSVNSITITGLAGAGWGVAGTSIMCVLDHEENATPPVDPFVVENRGFEVWPNPSTGLLNLRTDSDFEPAMISIENTAGKQVLQINDPDEFSQLDLSALSAGMYYLKVRNDRGNVIRKKITKL